jgi:hypothetical protein
VAEHLHGPLLLSGHILIDRLAYRFAELDLFAVLLKI